MTIECILGHIYKHHTTLSNSNSLVSGADASLLRSLFLHYTTAMVLVFSVRQGTMSFSTSSEATGTMGHRAYRHGTTRLRSHNTVPGPKV